MSQMIPELLAAAQGPPPGVPHTIQLPDQTPPDQARGGGGASDVVGYLQQAIDALHGAADADPDPRDTGNYMDLAARIQKLIAEQDMQQTKMLGGDPEQARAIRRAAGQ